MRGRRCPLRWLSGLRRTFEGGAAVVGVGAARVGEEDDIEFAGRGGGAAGLAAHYKWIK